MIDDLYNQRDCINKKKINTIADKTIKKIIII